MAAAALPLVLVTGVKAGALATGTPLLDHTLLPVFPDFLVDSALYSTGGLLGAVAYHVLAFAGLLALAACGQPVRTRSWCWLLPIPLLAAADPAWLGYTVGAPRRRPGSSRSSCCSAWASGPVAWRVTCAGRWPRRSTCSRCRSRSARASVTSPRRTWPTGACSFF
ncbi:hypothetical protein ACFQX6_45975 [Streptosporangium lutulentum]